MNPRLKRPQRHPIAHHGSQHITPAHRPFARDRSLNYRAHLSPYAVRSARAAKPWGRGAPSAPSASGRALNAHWMAGEESSTTRSPGYPPLHLKMKSRKRSSIPVEMVSQGWCSSTQDKAHSHERTASPASGGRGLGP